MLMIIAFLSVPASGQTPLADIHTKITMDYPELSHIKGDDLYMRILSGDSNLVILDTRPEREFNVSHIPGALQIDPNMNADDFAAVYSSVLTGNDVVLYCSVGRRSSQFGERVKTRAREAGAAKVMNLEGGIFGWHNDGHPLENENGGTVYVHPYNFFWGRLIENKDRISYVPKSSAE